MGLQAMHRVFPPHKYVKKDVILAHEHVSIIDPRLLLSHSLGI